MSQVLQCDLCKKIIDNPYKAKVIKFLEVAEYDYKIIFPKNHKEKLNIDLYEDCLNKLKVIKDGGGL